MPFPYCRIFADCTDVAICCSKAGVLQRLTYSCYHGMNSFKVLLGVTPNAVSTYTSSLYPGSISDNAVVQNCEILSDFVAGDLILADKGFLIEDILPVGVAINIPPFLEHLSNLKHDIPLCAAVDFQFINDRQWHYIGSTRFPV